MHAAGPRKRLSSARPEAPGVPEWRVRVHAARRRAMLLLLPALRLRRGLRHHPRRLRRVDSFGDCVAAALGAEGQRFVAERDAWLHATQALQRNAVSRLERWRHS